MESNQIGLFFFISFYLLVFILFVISMLHFYWAQGGEFGFVNALPQKENGEPLFVPKKVHSAIVGIGLLGIIGLLGYRLPLNYYFPFVEIIRNILWVVAIVFILRAIGDFKYVGFFKKIQNTEFGKLDTKYYSPLCLLIGILILFINYIMPLSFFIH